jgi:hypothetical protein
MQHTEHTAYSIYMLVMMRMTKDHRYLYIANYSAKLLLEQLQRVRQLQTH